MRHRSAGPLLVPRYRSNSSTGLLSVPRRTEHHCCVTAIYRALIGPLVEQVRRVTSGDSSTPPAGVGLALGGGFARGFAHLGVIQVLEENQIPISCVAGTSVGSILAAAYASGVPLPRIASVCRGIHFRDFGRWRLTRLGLASNDRMADLVHRCFNALTFEELLIPTAVVATDLGTGDPFVFTRGDLVQAIRASCAFPGLFEPVHAEGRCLADGGLVAPVPTQAVAALGACCVVGVSVSSNTWDGSAPTNIFQVFNRALSAAQKNQTESWRAAADILLEPDVQTIDWDHFHRADEAIAAGAAAARSALPRLRELLGLPASAKPEPKEQATGSVGWKERPAL